MFWNSEFIKQFLSFCVYLHFLYQSQVVSRVHWLVDSVLGTWEESIKSIIRELFTIGVRIVNEIAQNVINLTKGLSNLVEKRRRQHQQFAQDSRDQKDNQNKSWSSKYHQSVEPWKEFWNARKLSTFNALIEQEWLSNRSTKYESGSMRRSKRTVSMPALDSMMDTYEIEKMPIKPTYNKVRWDVQDDTWIGSNSGSDLFAYASGWGILENLRKRGVLEDVRIWLELNITRIFDIVRKFLRWVLLLPRAREVDALIQGYSGRGLTRSLSADNIAMANPMEPRQRQIFKPTATVHRSKSAMFWNGNNRFQKERNGKAMSSLSAAEVIRQAGYPLEIHVVTTQDGYVIRMERIARKNAKNCAFFVHGILDTSLAWVCNGVSGSQAFAAYDQGFDVWLSNTRNNPPHLHANYRKGRAYWDYSVDEIGVCDLASQIKHIHMVKCRELASIASAKQQREQQHHPVQHSYNPLEWIAHKYSLELPKFHFQAQQQRSQKRSSLDGGQSSDGSPAPHPSHNISNWFSWTPVPDTEGEASTETQQSQQKQQRDVSSAREGSPQLIGDSLRSFSYGPLWSRFSKGWLVKRSCTPPPKKVLRDEEDDFQNMEPDLVSRKSSVSIPAESSSQHPQQQRQPSPTAPDESEQQQQQPYALHVIGHSLGGAALLIYVINCLRQKRLHHVNYLLLLTPAGIHKEVPILAKFIMWAFSPILYLARFMPPTALCIPTPLLRALAFKLSVDLTDIPALGELFRLMIRTALSGDTSDWDRALQMPHYGATAMPTVSLKQLCQLVSWAKSGRMHTKDTYDILSQYNLLDIPVDLVAGRQDGIISSSNIRHHFEKMDAQGVAVTYKEFDYGHLDFTFAVKEELRDYVLDRLKKVAVTFN